MKDVSDRTGRSPAVDAPFLLALVDLSPDGMALLEGSSPLEATITWTNASFDRLVFPGGGSAVGRSVLELAPVGDEVADPGSDAAAAITEATRWGDALVRGRDGAVVARLRPVPTTPGRSAPDQPRWALVASSTTATGVADEALRASEERFRALAANSPMGVFFSEVGLRLGYINDRFTELWGQPAAVVLGMGWLDSVHAADTAALVDALSGVLTGEPFDLVVRVRRGDGEQRWIRVRAAPVRLPGHGAGFVGSLEDVTDSRRQAEQLAHQATHDPLTGLPNRTLLWQRLEESLSGGGRSGRGRRKDQKVALLFFDLDDFKLVNDSLGHAAGDELLTTVAGRLSDGVRPDDMVVRLGGDEFVVLCHAAGQAEATGIAERLQASVRQPVALEGTEIVISASVGVVVANGDHSAEGLLRDADVAMYQAKQAGKARYAVFDERVREGLQDRLSLTADLRRAVAAAELGVVYQPLWDLRGASPVPVGLEALVRWDHPVRGAIPAAQIVTLADEHGLIDEMGALVLRRACTDLARWHREVPGAAQVAVGVNLTTSQLRNGRLVDQVATALADAGVSPAYLWLELTETVVIDDIDNSATVLDDLRALGVRLIVDDFGTGYSSLAYLHRLPVQAVKIDRRFVGRLEESASDAAIVAAIVAMADALGLTAIAEGVERPGQLAELRRLGCAQAQGYLLSSPVPAVEVPAILSQSAPSPRPLAVPAPSAR
jgi:diguanylate cyclase (GGDEF)-like protein/PAS domain S-box-containing protein